MDRDIEKFRKSGFENRRFWHRLGVAPSFKGLEVLDVGSGRGRMSVDLAQAGATRVVGLDINGQLIRFSNDYVREHYPHLVDRVKFERCDLKDYDEGARFDCMVSKDSFEHIIDLEGMLVEMKKRLKPGGRVYVGFGPTYTSPYGDHTRRQTILRPWGLFGRLVAAIPWAHLFMHSRLVAMYNRQRGAEITSLRDLQLNMYGPSDYRRILASSGFEVTGYRVNRSTSLASRVMSLLRRLPFLDEYCTHSLYFVLVKHGGGELGGVDGSRAGEAASSPEANG